MCRFTIFGILFVAAPALAEPPPEKPVPASAKPCSGYIDKNVGPTTGKAGLFITRLIRATTDHKDKRWLVMLSDDKGHSDPYPDTSLITENRLFLAEGWKTRSYDPDGRWYWNGYVLTGDCPVQPK